MLQLELEFGQGYSLEYLEVLDLLFHIDLHIASKFQSTFFCLLYFLISKRPLTASFFGIQTPAKLQNPSILGQGGVSFGIFQIYGFIF